MSVLDLVTMPVRLTAAAWYAGGVVTGPGLARIGRNRHRGAPGCDPEPTRSRTRELREVVTVDLDEARDFVRSHHRAVLATRRRGGGIQQSPVLAAVDDAGYIVLSSRETAYKTRNLRRDPWAQVCVFTDSFFGPWIVVEGTVDVLSLPDAMEPLVEYYRSVAGEHPNWDEYRQSMRDEQRVLLRLQARSAGPDRQG